MEFVATGYWLFPTGWSSIVYIRTYPLGFVKFLGHFGSDSNRRVALRSTFYFRDSTLSAQPPGRAVPAAAVVCRLSNQEEKSLPTNLTNAHELENQSRGI